MNRNERRVWFFLQVARVMLDLKGQGFEFMPYDFDRTEAEQALELAKGNSEVKRGLHMVWQAIDLVNVVEGKVNWKDGPAYAALNSTAKRYGLATGREWRTLKDSNHLESVLGWVDLGLIKG